MKSALLVNTLSRGGAERVVSVLWDYKLSESNDIDLFLLKDEVVYSDTKSYKVLKINKDITLVYNLARSIYFLKGKNYKVIQSHLDVPNFINCAVKFFGSSHTCQIVHCVAYSNSSIKVGFLSRLKIKILDFMFKNADMHIFKSQDMYEDYISFFKHQPKSFKVIHNPYDFNKIDELSNVSINHNDGSGVIRFIIVCRLAYNKRVDISLKALSLLQCDYKVDILGDGPEMASLQKLVRELGIEDKVNFLGFVQNPYPYYKQSDYYISASQAEGFPNTLVEAMHFGCIPVHSNCVSGPREILGSGRVPIEEYTRAKYGYLFNVNDHLGLLEAIKFSCEQKDYLNKKLKNSISNSVQDYSVSKIASQYYKVISNEI